MDIDDKGKGKKPVFPEMLIEKPGEIPGEISYEEMLIEKPGEISYEEMLIEKPGEISNEELFNRYEEMLIEKPSRACVVSSYPGVAELSQPLESWKTASSREAVFEGLSFSYHGKPLLRLNYLFPCEYEFFENDLEFLWGLFGGLRFPRAMNNLLFQSSGIDHSTGISMYKLDKTAVNHFQIIRGLSKDDVGLDDKYLRIDDLGSSIPKKVQHVSVRGGIDSSVLINLYQIKALQSLLLLRENGPCMDSLPHDLFRELPSLQVLDLSHMKISELPTSIGDATQLRYLNLSYTSVVELPNSLCNILTLETLKLRGLKLRRLPKAIRRLTSLKHLDVDVSCLLVSMPPGVGDLKHLRTLPAFVVRKQHGWHVTELKNLLSLRNLCILRLENLSTPEEAKEAALHKKFFLKKLEFHWSRLEDGLEVLENFRPTKNIEELQIVGYGGANFPSWVGDHNFRHLEAITIHNCSKCNVLPTLGRLSSLKFLRISHMDEVKTIDQQFLGRNISYSEDVKAFPMLEQLTFNGMPELNEWIGVKEGDFPNLQNLNIAVCSKLKALPELYHFQSLQQLEITLCPSLESFPHGTLPISLQSLVIIECPNMKERRLKYTGEDWEKLSHIPNILIDYQQISLVEEAPEVTNLRTSEKVTEDIILIPSSFNNRLSATSSLLGDGSDGRRQTKEQFEEAEKIVLRWDSRTGTPQHRSLWEESPEEAVEYLSAVDVILQLTEDLTLSHPDEGDIKDRVKSVLQLAMSRLEDEFRYILIRNTVPLDAGRLHWLIRRDDDIDDYERSVDDDSISSVGLYHHRGLSLGGDVSVDLIHPDAVVDLKNIAERMIRSGYENKCCQVYNSVRCDVLDKCLSILGIEKLCIKEVQRIESDYKMRNWNQVVKIVVRVLLSGEKYLCEQIFQGSESIKEVCFTQTAKRCVIQLLKFAEAIAIGKHSLRKLFRILGMYQVLVDALLKSQELFSDHSGDSVYSDGKTILEELEEAAKGTSAEFENAVQSETSWAPISGGGIHPSTKFVMKYVKFLLNYSDTPNLLKSSTDSPDHVESDDDISHSGIESSLGRRLLLLLSSMESNLERMSMLYLDGALQYIFLMNNISYIVQKVKDSDLGKLLGDDWVCKRSGQVRQYATGYLRASWSKVLSCLKDEEILGSGSSSNVVSEGTLKEKFKSFNLCFEEVYRIQTQWNVPDPQLREELLLSISDIVLPAFRSFVGRLGGHLESERHLGKYTKYTADNLENYLFDLFNGRTP